MMKTVILLLVLVAIGKGKVVFNTNLSSVVHDVIKNYNPFSKQSADKGVDGDFTGNNLDSNDIIPKDKDKIPKPEIHIELPVHNITTTEKEVKDESVSYNNTTESILFENSSEINTTVGNLSDKWVHTNVNDDDETDNNITNLNDIVDCDTAARVDNGTALILTPYIENGKIEEARNASRVDPEMFLGYESYSGFFTVNKTYNSNTFFWYFPVQKKKVNETPWIIWMQGGPGASSLVGLFDEIGPLKFNTFGNLKENPFTWLQNHSLVFIDNPVGTGFSFTEHPDGLVKDMATYGAHLYEAVSQFLQIFTELKTAPLFIAGESYAGKYVPALGMEIHKHKGLPGSVDINLEGLMIGNPLVDPSEISNVTSSFLHFGILNREQIELIKPLQTAFQQEIAGNNSVVAKKHWVSLISVILFITQHKQAYNFLTDETTYGRYVPHLKSTEMKKALHVGDIKYSIVNVTVNSAMAPEFLSSSKPLFEELLKHYRVLAYCGNLDLMLPCMSTSDHYRTWKWNGTSEFLKATRYPYYFKSRIEGYHKTGGHLTEVVIRGAGHMAPMDRPAPVQNLIARWTHDQLLSRRIGILGGTFLQEYVRNQSTTYF